MVIEALKAARDFIENDRQSLAESLTVKGEIVFMDDIDRGAMAEYVKVLGVIDGALKAAQAQESPFEIGQRLRQEGKGISDLWGAVGSDADMPEAQRGFDQAVQPAPVQEPSEMDLQKCWVKKPDGTIDGIASMRLALSKYGTAAQPTTCTWTKSADPHMPDTFHSTCGVVWTFTDDGPVENDVRFCPGCGAAVNAAAPEPEEDLYDLAVKADNGGQP